MILDEIVADKRKRLAEHKAKIDENTMKAMAEACTRASCDFYGALAKEGLSIIGEFKKASPSMGILKNKIELPDRIEQYNDSVDAISCLTEEDHFNGNIEYFRQVRASSKLPVIRKDFIIDEYQVYEAKVIGADAVLLIAAVLDDKKMKELYELAYRLGMEVLLEVHEEEEMLRALKLGARIVGVNNRNLKDFSISLETTKRLKKFMEENCRDTQPVFVSESGVTTADHIRFLSRCHVNALLIGRAFMESENPKELAKEWKGVYHSEGTGE